MMNSKIKCTILLSLFFLPLTLAAAADNPQANPDRMQQRIVALSAFGANKDGGVDRIAFSEADLAGRAYIMDLMREAGLSVRLDTVGNIIGRRAGSEPDLPPIMFGSHIDSVPGGPDRRTHARHHRCICRRPGPELQTHAQWCRS
jgi:beta-ureidopropionase / N-carbamoyl-L-amino-acid hydrolase